MKAFWKHDWFFFVTVPLFEVTKFRSTFVTRRACAQQIKKNYGALIMLWIYGCGKDAGFQFSTFLFAHTQNRFSALSVLSAPSASVTCGTGYHLYLMVLFVYLARGSLLYGCVLWWVIAVKVPSRWPIHRAFKAHFIESVKEVKGWVSISETVRFICLQ